MEKNPSVNWNSRKMVRSHFGFAVTNYAVSIFQTHPPTSLLFSPPLGQEYAQAVRMLGNGRCECFCFDGVTRLGHIRGKMRKKVWITAGDIILVAKRDFQDEKVDIIHKYTADEARNLKQYGELPENARINETAVDMAMADDNDDDDIGIAFDDI
jgi:translation initiation factor 1A